MSKYEIGEDPTLIGNIDRHIGISDSSTERNVHHISWGNTKVFCCGASLERRTVEQSRDHTKEPPKARERARARERDKDIFHSGTMQHSYEENGERGIISQCQSEQQWRPAPYQFIAGRCFDT